MKTKVVIAGAGALGLYLGGKLMDQGIDVAFLGHKAYRDLVTHEGLSLSEGTELAHHIPAHNIEFRTDPAIVRDAHWVWVTVKSHSTPQLCEDIAPYVRPGAHLLSFQNGVHNGVSLRKRFPNHSVQSVVVPFNVVSLGHGHFQQTSTGSLIVEADPEPSAERIEALLTKAKFRFQMVDHIYPVLWGKLLLNLNNAINALSGLPLKEELSKKSYRMVFSKCLEEALDVYERAGIEMKAPINIPLSWLPTLLKMPDAVFNLFSDALIRLDNNAFSSMWQDLQAYKKTEIEYINGELLRLADQLSVPVPTIRHVYDLVKSVEVQRAGCPDLPAEALLPDYNQVA
jgi:2-dehydropantoate 2-reductase